MKDAQLTESYSFPLEDPDDQSNATLGVTVDLWVIRENKNSFSETTHMT